MSLETRRDARAALLGRLIDHAALFPPASMTMADALAADRRARGSARAWMLGRFVCPASRIEELVAVAGTDGPPVLSVVLDVEASAAPVGVTVAAVEARVGDPRELRARVQAAFGDGPVIYVEDAGPVPGAGLHAKLRCGGEAAEAFPSVEEVAGFVAACRDAGTAFKATAGLHHPVRGVEAVSGLTMHGFLNLLGACCVAQVDGAGAGALERVLAEQDPAAFALDADGFAVHGRRFAAHEIAGVRRALFHGQGSCSFCEPVEDLRALGMLSA